MKFFSLNSDQLNKDTDRNEKKRFRWVAKATSWSITKKTKNNRHEITQRLHNRALQKVWKIWLQMHEGKGAWTETLSFCQFSRETTRNAVYSARPTNGSKNFSRKLQEGEKYLGRDQRYQQRTTEKTREILKTNGKPHDTKSYEFDRPERIQYACSQYGPKYFEIGEGGNTK